MRILITGGNGFLGHFLIRELLALNVEPISYDVVPPPGLMTDLIDKIKFVSGSVLHPTELIRACQEMDIERIVHLPSLKMAASQRNPLTAYELNVKGTLNVLEAASILNIERVVVASSVAVYSADAPPLQNEDDPTVPSTVYGMTKLAVEHLGATYAKDRDLRFVALRPTRLYGPGRTVGELEDIVISTLRNREFHWLETTAVEALYVADAARAFALATLAELPIYRAFNICSPQKYTVKDLVEVLNKTTDFILVEPLLPPRSVEALQPRLDSQRAKRELQWQPRFSLEDGLAQFVDWLKREELV